MKTLKPLLAATFLTALSGMSASRAADTYFPDIDKGRYLATVGDCTACHTPEGAKPMSGGKAIETPFGNLIAPNLTPDRETGIGAWTDDQFLRAMQEGIGHNGEYLYGAFPYTAYTKVSKPDLLAIRAYLNTLEPVHNKVDSNQLPFPFNIRDSLMGWNLLFFKKGEFKPDPSKTAEWNRGAYLAEGLAHCSTCHNSKNFLGGDTSDGHLRGYTLQGWVAPTITGDKYQGLGNWKAEDIVEYLRTGRNQFAAASGPMAEVVTNSTQHMQSDDLRAIAIYLLSQKADIKPPKPVSPDDEMMKLGQQVYSVNCSACHMANGEGVAKMFPSLKGSGSVLADDPATLTRVILRGAKAVSTDAAPTGPAMPAFAWRLNDKDAAAVTTFVRNSWGNAAPAVSESAVSNARDDAKIIPR